MKFLIDNAISPLVSESLNKLGIDSAHVRDFRMQDATDIEIFSFAYKKERIIITADTDFGFLLSRWNKSKPSVIIFRKGTERIPSRQIHLLVLNLERLEKHLNSGSIVIIEPKRIRIRPLPINI